MFPRESAKAVVEFLRGVRVWDETVRVGLLAVVGWAGPKARRPVPADGPRVQSFLPDPVSPGKKMADLLDLAAGLETGAGQDLPQDFDFWFVSEFGLSVLSSNLGR